MDRPRSAAMRLVREILMPVAGFFQAGRRRDEDAPAILINARPTRGRITLRNCAERDAEGPQATPVAFLLRESHAVMLSGLMSATRRGDDPIPGDTL